MSQENYNINEKRYQQWDESDKDFKTLIIKILQQVTTKSLKTNEKNGKSQQRKISYKKKQMEIKQLKNTITKIKADWKRLRVEWRWWKTVWLHCYSIKILHERAKEIRIARSLGSLLVLTLTFIMSTISSLIYNLVSFLGTPFLWIFLKCWCLPEFCFQLSPFILLHRLLSTLAAYLN